MTVKKDFRMKLSIATTEKVNLNLSQPENKALASCTLAFHKTSLKLCTSYIVHCTMFFKRHDAVLFT